MSATPDPMSTSFFAMPIVVSAWARSSSSPSSVAIANAASARRRPSSVSPAISRTRPENARTRAAAAETESPARASARARCSGTRSCSPRSQNTRARNDSASDARSVSPTASNASRAVSSASCCRAIVVGPVQRNGQLEQQVGPLGVVRPERERILVLRCGDREAVEPERAIAGSTEGESSALDDLVVVYHRTPGRARARSSSGTRASRRGPRDVRVRRSTPRPRGASAPDRHGGSGRRTTSRTSAWANANSLSPFERRAALAADEPLALERVEGRGRVRPGPVRSSSSRTPCRRRPHPAAGLLGRAARRGGPR